MLDTKEEQQFTELKKLAQKLHIPIPEAFLTLEVFDKNGKLIQMHRQRSHSWTRNAYNCMFSQLAFVNVDDNTFGAGKLSGKDTAESVKYGARPMGVSTSVSAETTALGFHPAAGEDGWGILVGSGTNAESFEDFALQTQLTEGTGAGQISHIASEGVDKSYADTTWTHTIVRYFNNNTGGSRDINEVALVGRSYAGTGDPESFTVARDKLASTVPVPDTGQLKVTYTISLTYPS